MRYPRGNIGRVAAALLLNLFVFYYFTPLATAASPSGTTMPSAPQIIDSAGNIWTPGNGTFYENAVSVTGAMTTLLLYYNNIIYASNDDGNWYSWAKWYSWGDGWGQVAGDPRGGSTNTDTTTNDNNTTNIASSSGTTIPSAAQIVDSAGNVWTRSGSSFYFNGIAKTSSITTLLLYYNSTTYASNTDGNWYAWNNGWAHVAGDPRGQGTTTALDLTGYKLTFSDDFTGNTISDSTVYDGAKWYSHAIQCCMATTDGSTTAMVGLASPQNPYALMPGGGLRVRLQKVNNHWTSGVLASVDNQGKGFSQQYGYFEMEAIFPSGNDTWPAFWMLNTAAKAVGAPAGEIDIVEYIANPGFMDYIRSTLHDWSDGSAPAWSANAVSPIPADGNYHIYGLLWTSQNMTFYYDGKVMLQAATPSIMHQPYYPIFDLGIGAGWPTEQTPAVNDMIVKHVRAYALPH